MAQVKRFNRGDRVQGARDNIYAGFYQKPGEVVEKTRDPDPERERYLVLFDCMDDPRHAYWFDRRDLKEAETDEQR